MRIIILVPCWKRSSIVSIVSKNFDILFSKVDKNIQLHVLYVFSENDPEIQNLKHIFKNAKHKRSFIYAPNELLGHKMNLGLVEALKIGFDYVMNCGSDDLISYKIFDLYKDNIKSNNMFFGINKVYFYEYGKDPFLFEYYNNPHVIGACRMIHRNAIIKTFKSLDMVYPPHIQRGLDTASAKNIIKCGFTEDIIDVGNFPYCVDIKSEENINSYDKILNSKSCFNKINKSKLDLIKKEFVVL